MKLGKLKGAAYTSRTSSATMVSSSAPKQGAQPVAVLNHKGVDVIDIIGRMDRIPSALAESKDAELRAAQADVQRITG